MADDTQAINPDPNGQEEPMPSSEPAQADDVEVEADATAETLPKDVSERTKEQFNKRLEANRALKEEVNALKEQLAKKEIIEPIFDSMRPKAPAQGLTQNQLDSVTDTNPATGERFINEDKLGSLLNQTTQQAQMASAQVQSFIEDQQTREAFTALPQLNPNGTNFDPDLHKATRAYILDSMMNPKDYNGRQLSYKEAGEMAAKSSKAEIAKVEAEATQQQTAKEQGSLEATGRSDRRQDVNTSAEQLREQVRLNPSDDSALAKLLGD